ncbi:hypothetical protein BU23DRAFT_603795 [Bimuria novae-zelandiae CBS 107.79]|uniref:Uncharacterized protein n=1 Tax=Bimuria novae-zelandiae CBS 107.79 TaxID=1447943 RepID=A0A6A5ULJ0_9PLEO|nr:hypothetical protein BU23DRAFT_603795 [Bimuria novae-zelandiae CBS 107.79]
MLSWIPIFAFGFLIGLSCVVFYHMMHVSKATPIPRSDLSDAPEDTPSPSSNENRDPLFEDLHHVKRSTSEHSSNSEYESCASDSDSDGWVTAPSAPGTPPPEYEHPPWSSDSSAGTPSDPCPTLSPSTPPAGDRPLHARAAFPPASRELRGFYDPQACAISRQPHMRYTSSPKRRRSAGLPGDILLAPGHVAAYHFRYRPPRIWKVSCPPPSRSAAPLELRLPRMLRSGSVEQCVIGIATTEEVCAACAACASRAAAVREGKDEEKDEEKCVWKEVREWCKAKAQERVELQNAPERCERCAAEVASARCGGRKDRVKRRITRLY